LTRQAEATSPDLIVWPESAIPGALNLQPDMQQAVADIARGSGAALVAGGPAQIGEQLRNSAYFISPDGRMVGRYDKVRPVPFGEYVPGRSWLPFLHYYSVRDVDISAGERQQVFRLGGMTLGPMICFESTFGWVSLWLARHGAQTLVILTNDGWFGRTAAPRQHAEIAVFRAVETGLYTIRAASTGISEIISPTGQVEASVPLLRRGVLRGAVAPRPSAVATLYVHWGLWFSYLAAAMAAGSVAWGLTRRRLPR
jgi:apolipoprotein N-acyltransferase